MNKMICIFAGARGKSELYTDAAYIARNLVERGCDIIYGGSSKGIMGAVAAAAKLARGKIIGVLPEKVHALGHFDRDAHTIVAGNMAERKGHFWDKSDAFLCLPGGVGTCDELFEVWTLTKLGYISPAKPIVVYNGNGFYDPLIELKNNMVRFGTMPEERAELVRFTNSPWEAVNLVTGSVMPATISDWKV